MKRRKITKRLLALITAVLMVASLLPSAVLATDQPTKLIFDVIQPGGDPVEVVEGTTGKACPYFKVKTDVIGLKPTCTSSDESVVKAEFAKQSSENFYNYNIVPQSVGEATITVSATGLPQSEEKTIAVKVIPKPAVYVDLQSNDKQDVGINGYDGIIIAKTINSTNDSVKCTGYDDSVLDVVAADPATDENGYYVYYIKGKTAGKTTINIVSTDDEEIGAKVTVNVVKDALTVQAPELATPFVFTSKQLADLQESHPARVESWTSRNHYFTYSPSKEPAEGIAAIDILTAAGVDVDGLNPNQVIDIIPSDKPEKHKEITVKQLLNTDRYSFPNSEDLEKGEIATEAQKAGKTQVPTIICGMDNSSARLIIGQVAPNERTNSMMIKSLTNGGTIHIKDEIATAIDCDVTADKASGSTVAPGTEIVLDSPSFEGTDVYYTLDGQDPTKENAAIYNYNSFEGRSGYAVIKAPNAEGTFTIKVMQTAYEKLDSNIKTFTYTVKKDSPAPAVQKGQTYKVSGQSYKVTKTATATAKGTVTFTKAKNAKNVVVPQSVKLADGKDYNITAIGPKAFAGKKIRTVTVKTKNLKKSSVKKCLKGSKVKTVKVKVGKKKINKTYVKKYKKIFTKKNAGKKVKVK